MCTSDVPEDGRVPLAHIVSVSFSSMWDWGWLLGSEMNLPNAKQNLEGGGEKDQGAGVGATSRWD